jgi:iron complex transport system permease protein
MSGNCSGGQMKFWRYAIPFTLVILLISYLSLNTGVYHLQHSVFSLIGKSAANNQDASILWLVRFPRLLAALLVGAGLGIAGALAQALFRNPLAEPTLIGISSGAAIGAITTVNTGLAAIGSLTSVSFSVLVALETGVTVLFLAPKGTFQLLLTGIALSAVLTALAGVAIETSGKPGVQSITFWDFGSFATVNFSQVRNIAGFIIAGALLAFYLAPKIDLYTLGDSVSHYFGIRKKYFRYLLLISLALIVGSSVNVIGAIAFLGLISPHIARFLVGPKHKLLLPMSAIIGSFIAVTADLLARTLFPPNEIPVGLLTSIIGAPALIILLRSRPKVWGEVE